LAAAVAPLGPNASPAASVSAANTFKHCSLTFCFATPCCLCPAVQSEDPDYKWVLTVMGFWLKFFGGLLGLVLSICWILQIILYILIDPPVTPLLNEVFIK
jgi:hypothetical protein